MTRRNSQMNAAFSLAHEQVMSIKIDFHSATFSERVENSFVYEREHRSEVEEKVIAFE